MPQCKWFFESLCVCGYLGYLLFYVCFSFIPSFIPSFMVSRLETVHNVPPWPVNAVGQFLLTATCLKSQQRMTAQQQQGSSKTYSQWRTGTSASAYTKTPHTARIFVFIALHKQTKRTAAAGV